MDQGGCTDARFAFWQSSPFAATVLPHQIAGPTQFVQRHAGWWMKGTKRVSGRGVGLGCETRNLPPRGKHLLPGAYEGRTQQIGAEN